MSLNPWNEIIAGLPDPHLLQTWEWGQVKARYGWQPLYLVWTRAGQRFEWSEKTDFLAQFAGAEVAAATQRLAAELCHHADPGRIEQTVAADLRGRLKAPARQLTQDLYVSTELKTGRVMVKDEDVCLHCGLCAERCPTGAWDMQKFRLDITHAGGACRDGRFKAPLSTREVA